MIRPTVIVAEPEPPEALSTRKLVLETAKFNVLTVHSTEEALETFAVFPECSTIVLVASEAIDCEAIVTKIRSSNGARKLPIIALAPRIGFACEGADYVLPSGDPHSLLELARSLFGDPRAT